jgi:hypothetical protein
MPAGMRARSSRTGALASPDAVIVAVDYTSGGYALQAAAAAAREVVLELVKAGGIFHLADSDGIEPIPFHAETAAAVGIRS